MKLNLQIHCLKTRADPQTRKLDPSIHRESVISLAASRICSAFLQCTFLIRAVQFLIEQWSRLEI